jgi:transcriptional regulator with XRE-family HTH domain
MSGTEFAKWRARLGITQAEAAVALGVSIRTIKEYEAGVDFKDRARKPPLAIRKVMASMVKGLYLEPWPE